MSSEGSVFRRGDGKRCAKYRDADGKWRYLYRKSKEEAKQALREGIVPASKMGVATLLDEWLDSIKDSVNRRTWENREGFDRLHIEPSVGTRSYTSCVEGQASDLLKGIS